MSFGTSFALTTRPTIMGRSAAVVAGHQLAAQAGQAMLRAGGNAVDAGIATAAALAVLKPDACGLGSDLFLLYRDAHSGIAHALNASGPAPKLATLDAFARDGGTIRNFGLRAASVPGAVDGWERAISRFGRLSLRDVLAPAIALAKEGMPVSAFFAASLAKNENVLSAYGASRAMFYPDGRAPKAGEVLVQAELARTLEAIADGGAAAFYRGDFAEKLDRYSRESGGFLRAGDLAGYESEWRRPLQGRYRNYELIGQPPVSVGVAVLEAMQILSAFTISGLADSSAELIHLQVEAMKLAMRDLRANISDPAFVGESAVPELLDPRHAARLAAEIRPDRAAQASASEVLAKAGTDTSYAAAIDAEGNIVSLLQSVYHVFGCGEVIPGTGAIMNNRMTGFSLDPASPNVLAPGKRTLHTLNPLLARSDDGILMALGTPGGPSQVYTNVSLLTRAIDYDLDLQRAVDAPRWFVTPGGDLQIETAVPSAARDHLRALGHRVVDLPAHSAAMGGAGMVRIGLSGVREAAADPRREAYALAY